MASAFRPKKFFPCDCLRQWAQKVIFSRLSETMSPKNFFLAIVRYNEPKKFFSCDCTIQWAEKVFFSRLYDTMGRKSFFRAIVRYNGPKKFFSCDCTIQWLLTLLPATDWGEARGFRFRRAVPPRPLAGSNTCARCGRRVAPPYPDSIATCDG